MLARITASRVRVWLAGRLFDAAHALRLAGIGILDAEERRWGLKATK